VDPEREFGQDWPGHHADEDDENTPTASRPDRGGNAMKIALATALLAAGVLTYGTAHANPNDPCEQYSRTPDGYVADMHRCGFASLKSDEALLTSGQRMCDLMRSQNADGDGPSRVKEAVQAANGWDYMTAANYVAITLADLCPELVRAPAVPTPSVPPPLPPSYRDGD
jgi:uncharacterized protein DUF732